MGRAAFALIVVLVLVAGMGWAAEEPITVASAAFEDGSPLPVSCSYGGLNQSVPIFWSGIPAGTKALALICHDPDAPRGDWTHWLVYHIPPSRTGLPANIPDQPVFPDGMAQGTNDFGDLGWDGPAPPSGIHRYVFTVYALDMMLELAPGATKEELFRAMRGHVLGQGSMLGTFSADERQ